jgi:AhpD family alkylhydroperoxidase
MDEIDKNKIEKIISDRKTSHDYFLKNSNVYKSFVQMEQNTFTDGNLSRMNKELIALGISIVINCESCMEWHIKEALNAGASIKQIIEAIEVGIEMGGGPATVASRFALKVIDYYKENFKIKEIADDKYLSECHEVIKSSFKTVADELNLTKDNCPTHPSFIGIDKLVELKNKNVKFFGLFIAEKIIGFAALEKADESTYYLEKLSVIPDFRHYGYGRKIMDYIFDYTKKMGGKIISIGIINEHTILKKWYSDYGFKETLIKEFPHLPFKVCFMERSV